MFFTGTCFARSLSLTLANAMLTPDPAVGAPLWTMVSSNVGTTWAADGYVFRSNGAVGGRDIFVGISSEISTTPNHGFRTFIAENYTPNQTQGVNGTFVNQLSEQTVFAASSSFGTYTVDNILLEYWFSITAFRVIIAYVPLILDTSARASLIYLGRPRQYFGASDRGSCIASTSPFTHNTQSVRTLGVANSNSGTVNLAASNASAHFSTNFGFSRTLIAAPLLVVEGGHYIRAELDLMTAPQDGRLRNKGLYTINGVNYIGFDFPPTHLISGTSYTNNLTPTGGSGQLFLMPRV